VHHCDGWRIKDQLDVTCYFISLLMCSTCSGHLYTHHQELATILLNYQIGRIVLGLMCVGVSVWLGWSGIRVAGWSLQHSCKLLMMDILISKTCWAHKKWNKITSDIKFVFYSSRIFRYYGYWTDIKKKIAIRCILLCKRPNTDYFKRRKNVRVI